MLYLRGLAVWLVIIFAESLHGALRTLLLEPYVGEFRARQLAVFTGAALILFISSRFVRWLRATTTLELLLVGVMWLILTISFELALGRLMLHLSWERIGEDYNLLAGGLLPIGLLVLTFSPWLSAKWRDVTGN